jgi:hypothetical protein
LEQSRDSDASYFTGIAKPFWLLQWAGVVMHMIAALILMALEAVGDRLKWLARVR